MRIIHAFWKQEGEHLHQAVFICQIRVIPPFGHLTHTFIGAFSRKNNFFPLFYAYFYLLLPELFNFLGIFFKKGLTFQSFCYEKSFWFGL